MSIRSLRLYHIALPLKSKVKHASFERIASDSLIAEVTLSEGIKGYGEGVPRAYVTGETIESAFKALRKFDIAAHIGSPRNYADVVHALESINLPETLEDPRGMNGNAARCALELALLDAYGKLFQKSLTQAIMLANINGLKRKKIPSHVRYSGAIMASSPAKETHSAIKMWLYNFRQIKVKVGVDGQDDPHRLKKLRKIFGKRIDLRVDANEAWPANQVIEMVRPLIPSRISVLEQPVKHSEVSALSEIRQSLNCPIMIDESLCGFPDATRSIDDKTADFFNVRISKCGGILPSLKIIGLAHQSGIQVQLGCHPGETGLLSAAGRHLGSCVDEIRYLEGSYDSHILSSNIIDRDITFGYGGWAPPLKGFGLGVEVVPHKLQNMIVAEQEVLYD